MRKLLAVLLLLTATFAYTGCKEKSETEKAKEAAEKAADQAEKGLKDLMGD